MKNYISGIIGVFLCSSTNSTMFTECCNIAICNDQINCPKCQSNVIGYDAENNHNRGMIRWKYAFKKSPKYSNH